MPALRQLQITIDCAEPARLAAFWCEAAGYVLPPVPEGFASWEEYHHSLPAEEQPSYFACRDPTGVGPRLLFQRVPEGKTVKNRVHIDVRAGQGLVGDERLATLRAEQARLEALGAVHLYTQLADDENKSCVTMQDIEGNEFCLD
ncbi:VOC family protein [Streptomyces sp. NRRL F-5630]|uniref:VOC family protein n=1 Tax=Streptomyces sp. NRRL F-5630 TaxID=1463864 RepID=UPI003EC0D900